MVEMAACRFQAGNSSIVRLKLLEPTATLPHLAMTGFELTDPHMDMQSCVKLVESLTTADMCSVVPTCCRLGPLDQECLVLWAELLDPRVLLSNLCLLLWREVILQEAAGLL